MLKLALHLDPSFCLCLLAVRSVFSYWLGKAPALSIVCVTRMRGEAIALTAGHGIEGLAPHIWVPKPAGGRTGVGGRLTSWAG